MPGESDEEEQVHRRSDGPHVREADATSIAEAAKTHGISDRTVYAWRKKFRGMDVDDVNRLKALEMENAHLKKLVAEQALSIEVNAKMVSARARRKQVAFATARGLSQRRACTLFRVSRSALRYQHRLDERDAPLIKRMAELAKEHPRYGYRRIRALLGREGKTMSRRRAFRLWQKAGLKVPRKRRRRVPRGTERPVPAMGAGQVWAYDFVHDMCANGQALKCLTIVDEYTRECLAIDVAGSIRSGRVIDQLARLVTVHGAPRYLRSDNGPEFVAEAVCAWLKEEGIETVQIEPGKPWQNGLNESFNGKFRDECLGMEWFPNRREAVVIDAYRKQYNDVRPHSSLGYRTPNEYKGLLHPPRVTGEHEQTRSRPCGRRFVIGVLRQAHGSRPDAA